jgi:hypothetical protein
MDSIHKLQINYDEFELIRGSNAGWKIVPGMVESIVGKPIPFKGWVYHYDSASNYYVKIEEYEDEDKYNFTSALKKYIYKAALCMIRTDQIGHIEQLLSGYSKVSSGIINNNLKSEVFPAPIEIGDWAEIEAGKIILIICHDGDPLFVLRRQL